MTPSKLLLSVCSAFALLATAAPAFAHATGSEAHSASECDVLTGTALGGPRGECLRCIGRAHYHYHPDLARRERCHRENGGPRPASAHHATRHHHH